MKTLLLASAAFLVTGAFALADDIIILKRSDVWTGSSYGYGVNDAQRDPTHSDIPPLLAPTQTQLEGGLPVLSLPGSSKSYYIVNLTSGDMTVIDYWTEGTLKRYAITAGLNLNDMVLDRVPLRTANQFQWFIASSDFDNSAPPFIYTSDEYYTGLGSPLAIPASTAAGYPVRTAKTIPNVPRTIAGKWFESYVDEFAISDPTFDTIAYADMYVTTVSWTLDTINTPLANNGARLPVCSEATNAAVPGQFWDSLSNSSLEYATQLVLNILIKLGYDQEI